MRPSLKEVQVVGLGQVSFDFLGHLPGYPQEDHKAELTELLTGCGGPAATAMAALSRLKVPTSFIGAVGDDRYGTEIRLFLEAEGVDVTFLKTASGCSSQVAFIAVASNGSRTVFWHPGNAPPPGPAEIDLSPFTSARILHLDGLKMEASIQAARKARSRGLTVVLDAGTFREGTGGLLPLVDILIASERFADPVAGAGASEREKMKALSALGPARVVMTLGVKGSIGMDRGRFFHQPAFRVQPVDTTGAGDVYHGAYIYGVLEGYGMPECMKFASAAAAFKCTVSGNRKGLPRLEQVLEIMAGYT